MCVCLCVCVSFRLYTRRRLWSDRDHILHTHADSSPNGSELNKNQPQVTLGGLGGQKFKHLEGHQLKLFSHLTPIGVLWGVLGGQKSGKAAKRLQRFAPNLIHTCRFIRE